MNLLRFGTLSLVLGTAACAPATQGPVLSGGWLAENAMSVQRPATGAGSGDTARNEPKPLRHRMVVRERTDEGVRPLFVTFVGPDGFTPKGADAPRIVPAAAPLQCVPFARELSGVALRGNAWTWWGKAEGRYARSKRPEVGAIMVLSRTEQLPLGHLAVVTEVLGKREIIVSHANWLGNGGIHLDTPVVDVSPNNDWSVIRAWYTPGKTLGLNVYAVSGFILPDPVQSAERGS